MTLQNEAPDLVLEAVTKSFGEVRAVDVVSVAVRRGEFFSLLGPSGCGKTTTLRLVAGFERPDGGRVLLRGDDVTAVPPNGRRVNTVFQHYALFPHMTVEANVGYGLKHAGVAKKEAGRRLTGALQTVRLESLRERYPRELSGGQQQRVALARALVNEPTVLLLDEPLAALDLKLRREMQVELKRLQERVGITFVYVTHDQEEALTLSDRIGVMNDGHLLQTGSPDEIYERPRTRFVADFIGDTNLFEGVVEDAGAPVVVAEDTGLRLRCAPAAHVRRGRRVSVSVRPEHIAVGGHGTAQNLVTGTLSRRVYLGDIVKYHVVLPGGREVVVQRQNDRDDPAARWDVGGPVQLGWDETSALVLDDDRQPERIDDERFVRVEGARG